MGQNPVLKNVLNTSKTSSTNPIPSSSFMDLMVRGRTASAAPRGEGQRAITLDDVLVKTLLQFAVLLPVAGFSWLLVPPILGTKLALVSSLIAFVLVLVISFSKRPSIPLIFLYAALEGFIVGVISRSYGTMFDNSVQTALLATTVTVVCVVAGVRMGFLRTSSQFRRIVFYSMIGYAVFALICIVAALLGFSILTFGTPFSLLISLFGVILAASSVLMDVEDVKEAVYLGVVDEGESWKLSFGLVVSVVWLYFEILRFVANIMAWSRD